MTLIRDDTPPVVSTSVDTTLGPPCLGGPLDAESARHLTTAIKIASEALWVLLARAKEGRAWEALGYPDWKTYVSTELGLSRSRSYQLLDQFQVNAAIEAAAGVPLDSPVSEAMARDLKPNLTRIVDDVRERTLGLTDPRSVLRVVTAMLNAARHPEAERLNVMPSMAALRGSNRMSASGSDIWYTPRQAIAPLLQSLPQAPGRVWCPADVDGSSNIVDMLREQGYEVVCSDLSTGQDFLAYTRETMPTDVDFVVTNPPYSLKRRWVEHLGLLGIDRWALLVPEIGLGDWGFGSLSVLGDRIGMVMLNRRIAYSGTFGQRPIGNPPFSSVWLVANMMRPGEQVVFREVPTQA